MRTRPGWVWVIFFYLFSAGWILLSFFLIYSGRMLVTPAQQNFLANLTAVDFVGMVGLRLLSLTAAVFLFCLHRSAVIFFTIALALSVGHPLIQALTTSWVAALGGPGLVGAMVGWGVQLVVLLYSRRLVRQAILT